MASTVRWLALACCLAVGCAQEGGPAPMQDHLPAGFSAAELQAQETAFEADSALAEEGDAEAQARLAVAYYNGRGTPLDQEEGIRWARLAAEQENARAQALLAAAHFNGMGAPQDHEAAVRWARLAAERGDAGAQVLLGMAYVNGFGVVRDYVEAYMWLTLAASGGGSNVQGADQLRSLAAMRMTPDQIEEAEQRAQNWEGSPE